MDERDKLFCLFLETRYGEDETIEETGYSDIGFTFLSDDDVK